MNRPERAVYFCFGQRPENKGLQGHSALKGQVKERVSMVVPAKLVSVLLGMDGMEASALCNNFSDI